MKRDFETWFKTMRDTIATFSYFTNFENVYAHVEEIKTELNILNSLIGSRSIRNDFIALMKRYPEVTKAIPILLAKREMDLSVASSEKTYCFRFAKGKMSAERCAMFMERSGLFDLIGNHIINNLVDYVLGVEVGLDSNARKNRTGKAMEDLVESYLIKSGLRCGTTYFRQFRASDIKCRFGIDLASLTKENTAEKKFDFVFLSRSGELYASECNFYNGGGSKLNETARSYKMLALESKGIKGFHFVWLTDGKGWETAKSNLCETFDVLDDLYNIQDMEEGCLDALICPEKAVEKYMASLNGIEGA